MSAETCDACQRDVTHDGYYILCEECHEKREPLVTFGRAVLQAWWNDGDPGDLDGGCVQDMAEAAGLWRAVQEGEHSEDCEACGGAGGCGELTDSGLKAVTKP